MMYKEPDKKNFDLYDECCPSDTYIEDDEYHKNYVKTVEQSSEIQKINVDTNKHNLKKITNTAKQNKHSHNLPEFVCPVYTGKSQKYNMYKYVYGRLFAQLHEFGTCEIIEETGMIYSWATWLLGLYNRQHILWFDIKNVDETHSKLTYIFNNKNRILEYEDYLEAIAYCIDNNR